MKLLRFNFLLVLIVAATAKAQSFHSPDILISSKLDYDFSEIFVKKMKVFLKNHNLNDPFNGKIEKAIIVDADEMGELLPSDSKLLLSDFGNAVGINIIKSDTKVWLEGLTYEVHGFKTNLKITEKIGRRVSLIAGFTADEVAISADKLLLALAIPGKSESLIEVEILRPQIVAKEENLINFFAKIALPDSQDHFKLNIEKASFTKMAEGLLTQADNIELSYDKLIIPEVSFKIGKKTIDFSSEKIQQILKDNHDAIKGLILAKVALALKSNMKAALAKLMERFKLMKDYNILGPFIQSQFKLSTISETLTGNNLELSLQGDFCTAINFKDLNKDCIFNRITQSAQSRLIEQQHKNSIQEISDILDQGESNLVASISEQYLNKLLATTYDAGLWKAALETANVELGPKKVILHLDKRGESATVILDVVYRPTKFEKFMTSAKAIRFPLVLDVGLRVEIEKGNPVVVIRINQVDTSTKTLMTGLPSENILSTVKDVPRFQDKVLSTIREKISSLGSKDIVQLPYPELRGIGLEKIEFFSDGNGRMNAVLKLDELIEKR